MKKGILILFYLTTVFGSSARAELPEFDCVIEPHVVIDVSSAVEGVIEKVHVDRDDVVSAGQTLAELDSRVERATVELARARAEITSEIEYREVDLGLSKRNQRRVGKLYQRKVASLHENDEAATEVVLNGLQLRQARENQRLAELELKKANALLALRSVRSPVSGVVVERYKSSGEFVYDQQPLLKLAQLDPLRVEIVAPLQMYGAIRPGMRVEVVPESPMEGVYAATVSIVDRVVDAASGTFGVRLELPNPDYKLPAGLRCRARFPPGEPMLKAAMADGEPPEPESTVAQPPPGTLPDDSGSDIEVGAPTVDLSFAAQTEIPATVEFSSATRTEIPAFRDSIDSACRVLGPFLDPDQAETVESALINDVVTANRRTETESSVIGYLVLVSPEDAGTTGNALSLRLRESGVDDQFFIRKGPYAGEISVGYYAGQQSAQRRRAELISLGYSARVAPRVKERVHTWLDLELPEDGLTEATLLGAVDRIYPELNVGIASCEQVSRAVEES